MRINIYILSLLSLCICYGNAERGRGEPQEQDPNNPKYQKMAEEVVYSYLHVIKQLTKKITVNKVTTQVVAGTITRLQFQVFLVNGKSSMCNAEIWEKPWENIKHVTYNCDSLFSKKQLSAQVNPRPEQLRDPNNPKYRKLANLALDTYLNSPGNKLFKKEDVRSVSVLTVKVTLNSQIGNSLLLDVKTDNKGHFQCVVNVLETPWKSTNTAQGTKISCFKEIAGIPGTKLSLLQGQAGKNQQIGGQEVQDPKDPKYKQLAKESFDKYRKTYTGPLFKVKEFQITKVTTQMVAGVVTKLNFNVITDSSYRYKCKSKVLEQPWRQVKDITVKCMRVSVSRLKLNGDLGDRNTGKVGGKEEQDPKDPKYKELAEESFRKFRDEHIGPLFLVKELRVTRVTTQVVSGVKYAIDFKVSTDKSYTYDCHSDIWDQPWLKNKDITVNCIRQKDIDSSSQFPIAGAPVEQDPHNPTYQELAKESFQKYRDDHIGLLFTVKELKVTKVTTQLVSGVITLLDFQAILTKGNLLQCHSEIFEKSWEQIKDITVTCTPQSSLKLSSEFLGGGELEQDPNSPEYKKLAEESFEKYRHDNNIPVFSEYIVKKLLVTKVTTQVVSGIVTRLDFKIISTTGNSLQCHSAILEQPWLQNKDIRVYCFSPVESKKALSGGKKKLGQGLQDIALDSYFAKIDTTGLWKIEQKHLISSKTITTRVGKREYHYFNSDVLVSTSSSGEYNIFNCSEVFEAGGNPTPIGVNCVKQTRLRGRSDWTDPTDEGLISYADKALQKYSEQPNSYLGAKGTYDIIITFATKGVVAGWRYVIDFIVRSVGDIAPDLNCHAVIIEELTNTTTVDKVNCNQNPNQETEY